MMSHKEAAESAELSRGVVVFLANTLDRLHLTIDQAYLHTLIRKTAHALVYLVLGFFTVNALSHHHLSRKKTWGYALIITLFYAISDEFHQTFIPGRSGEVLDVLIDMVGASMGIGARHGFQKIIKTEGPLSR